MILGDKNRTAANASEVTLDDIFRRNAARRPDALALADPTNRDGFTDGAPRWLTYAQADRIVSAIAGRLHRLGLPIDTVVAFQLPNTVESLLMQLGALRAGMIAAPLPLLWRKQEITAALSRIGAKIIITSTRIGASSPCEPVMQAAAELFPVRYVCAFGNATPDGVVPFDDLFSIENPDPLPAFERTGNAASHVAAVTFDVTANGLLPVARNHTELIAGGLAVFLKGCFAKEAITLSTIPISSFAGMSLTLTPWLLGGGTLALHQAFDADILASQCAAFRCDTVVLPGSVSERIAEAGHLASPDLQSIIALWRTPERLSSIAPWRGDVALIDVSSFGEIALLAAQRDDEGMPSPITHGILFAPEGSPNAMLVAETKRTANGTLALGGPMVPGAAFPPGAERGSDPHVEIGRDGFIDTGYTCRVDGAGALIITGSPAGIASVGGYRFRLRDVDTLMETIDGGATIAALPDALTGQRLAGHAPDSTVCRQLTERGVNPLIGGAFGPPRGAKAA